MCIVESFQVSRIKTNSFANDEMFDECENDEAGIMLGFILLAFHFLRKKWRMIKDPLDATFVSNSDVEQEQLSKQHF